MTATADIISVVFLNALSGTVTIDILFGFFFFLKNAFSGGH